MPGVIMDGTNGEGRVNEQHGNPSPGKEASGPTKSPLSTLNPQSPITAGPNPPADGFVDTSIEQLYENVCDMRSSDQSVSSHSLVSDGDESQIDSELRHLVGGEMREVEIIEEEVTGKPEGDHYSDSSSKDRSSSPGKKSEKMDMTQSVSQKSLSPFEPKTPSSMQLGSETLSKSSAICKSPEKPPIDQLNDKALRKKNTGISEVKKQRSFPQSVSKARSKVNSLSESGSGKPDLGHFLLKQARDLISLGDNPHKALELTLRAANSFEMCANGKSSLELVMCLHITAALHCSLGQYNEAIPVLERSIEIPDMDEGQEHALAKFAGHMQLGDTYAMLGLLEKSIMCYQTGLEIQKEVLGETDPRIGETCRYISEAHVQALQFNEAERLCQMALDIHKVSGSPASLEEAADRRLMGLICETKGDHEAALEHLVLASMAMVANGQELEVASVDCSIGDTYLSLSRYDEAIFAYQKALTVFKTSKGENHPAVGLVFVRLADLYNKTGKLRESQAYCESALHIFEKPVPGIPPEEIASGFTDISAIYESMNELEQALVLLQKALDIYNDAPGQQSTVAGIEAQMGVMYYMLGKYTESYDSFKNAISKLRANGEKKSAFFGVALNQMGLACVQRFSIQEAAELFEEARVVLEQECGPYHPDTLGVYSNLAGTYDAIGRLDDAIDILEYVVEVREEKLGTANPDVNDEKRRLAELLRETGRVRSRKGRSLEKLLDSNNQTNVSSSGIAIS